MKLFTPSALLLAPILLIAFTGCSKVGGKSGKGTNTVTQNKYTNPNTAAAVCDYDTGDTSLTNHGWTKTYDEEFSTGLSNWHALTGGVMKELECNEPANAVVSNGTLQITAKQQSVSGPKTIGNDTSANFNYTSGWIVSKQQFVANSSTPKVRIVARIKMASGYGLTNLFWGYGDGVWPTGGEIDFAETQGDNTKVYATDYAYSSVGGQNYVSGGLLYNPTTEDLSACYHVYTMEWTQNSLNSYLDGKLVESKTAGGHVSNLFGKPQYIAFSLPIGGLYYSQIKTANIQGGTMYVDYVKVFTSN
jgi:beta-glucanase (GH16 family)